MSRWRVLLLPPADRPAARPRWLCPEGGFSLDDRRAWTVVDAEAARERISRWIALKGHDQALLQRMRLVHCCSKAAAEAPRLQTRAIGCL